MWPLPPRDHTKTSAGRGHEGLHHNHRDNRGGAKSWLELRTDSSTLQRERRGSQSRTFEMGLGRWVESWEGEGGASSFFRAEELQRDLKCRDVVSNTGGSSGDWV